MKEDRTSEFAGRPWGLWSTLGFSAVIVIVHTVVSMVMAGVLLTIQENNNPNFNINSFTSSLGTNGFFFSISIIATALSCMGLILIFAAIRKGITLRQYLGLNPLPLMTFLRWLGIIIIFAVCWDGLSLLLKRPIVPDFIAATYKSAESYSLYWFSVVVAAPFLEEFFFRGFLFEGIRCSRLGSIGAVIVTSVTWAVIHLQYGMYEIVLIMSMGLILGIAKIKTRSLYTTIGMHAICNLLAMLEVAIFV